MADLPESVSLYDGLLTTRAIRRYADESVPDEVLRDILFAATRAPSGSNRQPFRFIVLTDGPVAGRPSASSAAGARQILVGQAAVPTATTRARAGGGLAQGTHGAHDAALRRRLRVRSGSGTGLLRPLPGHPAFADGASVYPACQNLLLAARALGYGGVMTGWHFSAAAELRGLLGIPDEVELAATITLGRPAGRPRSGPAPPTGRAGLRRAMGRGPGVGRRPRRARPTRPPARPTDRDEARCCIESRCCSRCSWKVDHARSRPAFECVHIDAPVFDADNHYYEALDAFTRHLDPSLGPRVIQWADVGGRRYHVLGAAASTGP